MSAKRSRAAGKARSATSPAGRGSSAGARGPHRAAMEGGTPQGATGAFASFAGTALALAFYFWTIGAPKPMDNIELRTPGFDPFAGLPVALGLGLAAAALLALAMAASAPLRSHRGAVALAAAGLYLAAALPAIGMAALVIAPLVAAGELAWIVVTKARPLSGSWLVALHAGAFVSAMGFFHDWARYAAAWEPFVRNLSALRTLLL